MVGRIETNVETVQLSTSAGTTSMNKDVQKVAPTPAIEKEAPEVKESNLPIEQAEKMVESMNDFLMSANSQLRFVFHDGLNEYYVTIVDSKTDDVIREIPSKKLMDIHAAMREFVGLLIDQKI